MEAQTYADGKRDGKIEAIEDILRKHHNRMDGHERRLRMLERVAWILMGVVGLINVWPTLEKLFT